jgi:hypothetical protein
MGPVRNGIFNFWISGEGDVSYLRQTSDVLLFMIKLLPLAKEHEQILLICRMHVIRIAMTTRTIKQTAIAKSTPRILGMSN